jgi:ribose-phosphate pyrophosphokinase
MKKQVIECSGAKHIAKKISWQAGAEYSKLQVKKFPDNELDIKFNKDIKGKQVFLIQSFYENLNEKIIETLFAAYTAKELKVKKINLIALHFPYFRKDKRFSKGDCISINVMSKLFKIFDKIYVVEPHLHRIKNIKKIMKNAEKVSVNKDIANYVKNIKNPIFIGPDMESNQWAKKTADILNEKSIVFRKERFSSKKVKINPSKDLNLKNKNIIIIDDIISTGYTMLETIKLLKKQKTKKIYCIGIHGIFADKKVLKKLKKYAEVLSTNTIPSKQSKIDITKTISEILK